MGGLVARTGSRIMISQRVELMKERLVNIWGRATEVKEASRHICNILQKDEHLQEHICLKYNIDLPLGVWFGDKGKPMEEGVLLIHPKDAEACTKRQLIEYLLKAAPRELLMRHGLLGKLKNTVKTKSLAD